MILNWFNGREAAAIGSTLADQYALQMASGSHKPDKKAAKSGPGAALRDILERADREVRTLQLNFYKKARFAIAFKWRLTEKGVDKEVADEVTQLLVLHLSQKQADSVQGQALTAAPADRPATSRIKQLRALGAESLTRLAYSDAAIYFKEWVDLEPRSVDALNSLGSALIKLGLLVEAEQCFHQAIELKPDDAEAHCHLGIALRGRGENAESEVWLRRALKLNPKHVDARVNLGVTLVALGRLREARGRFEKVLKTVPRHADAIYVLGLIARLEGRFDEAEARFKRVLEIDPKRPNAWAAVVGTRKMTSADSAWLQGAEEIEKYNS